MDLMMELNKTFTEILHNVDFPIQEPTWTPQLESDALVQTDEYVVDEGQSRLVQRSKFYIAIAMSVCCCVGFFGNTMSTLIFLHSDMRSPINTLLAAVSIIDLSLLLLIIPVLILPGLNTVLNSNFLIDCYIVSILYVYPLAVMSKTASMWTYVMGKLKFSLSFFQN